MRRRCFSLVLDPSFCSLFTDVCPCDYVVADLSTWLCAPRGCTLMWADKRRQVSASHFLSISHAVFKGTLSPSGSVGHEEEHTFAQRFSLGSYVNLDTVLNISVVFSATKFGEWAQFVASAQGAKVLHTMQIPRVLNECARFQSSCLVLLKVVI